MRGGLENGRMSWQGKTLLNNSVYLKGYQCVCVCVCACGVCVCVCVRVRVLTGAEESREERR